MQLHAELACLGAFVLTVRCQGPDGHHLSLTCVVFCLDHLIRICFSLTMTPLGLISSLAESPPSLLFLTTNPIKGEVLLALQTQHMQNQTLTFPLRKYSISIVHISVNGYSNLQAIPAKRPASPLPPISHTICQQLSLALSLKYTLTLTSFHHLHFYPWTKPSLSFASIIGLTSILTNLLASTIPPAPLP